MLTHEECVESIRGVQQRWEEAGGGWQDIKTAPRHGPNEPFVSVLLTAEIPKCPDIYVRIIQCEWNPHTETWSGWPHKDMSPTYWMPSPRTPSGHWV